MKFDKRYDGRVTWLLSFVIFITLSFSLSAQTDLSKQPISLEFYNTPIREVLDEIEHQTGLSFSYSSRLLKREETVSINVKDTPLQEILEILFDGKQIRYIFLEEQIVLKRLRRDQPKEQAPGQSVVDTTKVNPYTLSGYVKDAMSGEILIGATVTIPGGRRGAISNEYGFYSLTLEERVNELICTYVGYRNMHQLVSGSGNQIFHFSLDKELAHIREVVIYSDDPVTAIRTERSSESNLKPEVVRKMPALFGEKDVIKSLAAIPGIKFFGDGSTIFYVRGGMRDQNMITLDEAPIYNPAHLLGFFSTVVPDAIKDIQIYKGDFPANYGGRLSSLIDIRTKDGNMNRFGMDGSVGLISSRLSLEGPIWKDHISCFISGRRSYITPVLQTASPSLLDLHFSDFHAKLNYRINDKNRIYFSLYNGNDNYEVQNNESRSSGINWQNATTTLRWNHLFSEKLFSNTTIFASRYDYYLNQHIENQNYWNSHVDNFSIKTDFTWYQEPDNTVRYGVLMAEHFFNPGNYYRNNQQVDMGLEISRKRAREWAAYISDQMIIANRLSLRVGLRITAWQNVGEAVEYDVITVDHDGYPRDSLVIRNYGPKEVYNTYGSVDPRLSAVFRMTEKDLLKFSYSRASQFQYLITNSISPFTSLEVWLPSSPNVKPQSSDQFTVGYSHAFEGVGLEFEADAYYKKMHKLIDYKDHAHMLMNPLVEYELRFGSGVGYGLEFILSREGGKLNGWVSYTLSRALYTINGINNGQAYPAYSDRPHDFSTVITWQFKPRLTLTANFIYMTGVPYSTPTGFYYYEDHQVPIYLERNNDRLPAYHRLDLALNWRLNKPERRYKHELIFSIYNLYSRLNPVALHFNKIEDEGTDKFVVPYNFYSNPELTSTQFAIYGIVPSISYHFSL